MQYRETDFNFVSRLMEQEGIYYYFKHEDGKHTMVLADSNDAHEAVLGLRAVHLPAAGRGHAAAQGRGGRRVVCRASRSSPARTFTTTTTSSVPASSSKRRSRTRANTPRPTARSTTSPANTSSRPKASTSSRRGWKSCWRSSRCARAAAPRGRCVPGVLFKLAKHPRADQNREYLVTSAQYRLQFERLRGARRHRRRLPLQFHRDAERAAVPAGAQHAQADRAGAADGGGRRARRARRSTPTSTAA